MNQNLSNWEHTKPLSNYHFNDQIVDNLSDYCWIIGNFSNTWQDDLNALITQARDFTWENRKFTCGRNGPISPMLEQEEYDIEQGLGNPKMALLKVVDDIEQIPPLKEIVDFFDLDKVKVRIHVQATGQVFNRHIDKLDDIFPGVPKEKIVRIAVMLTDWVPGHFYQYGNAIYDRWRAGDAHWFDWVNVPHATANASNHIRATLQITGLLKDSSYRLEKRNSSTSLNENNH